MALTQAKAHYRGKIGAITRAIRAGERQPDDPELTEARQKLAAEGLNEYARGLVAKWPPLSDEQIATVADILRNGGAA
ncbi:hypothetical protein JDV09_15335 [Mycobacterium sp. Y57]|uniref:hypothetical protein n=1 Tax=Mycolicibacterium xanthum TaxID=2796469 RepID=UPI001C863720|nr:hypothetical protein [Mycolicibacterium xanthum]MBX7433473.1 hypothetical protein [Mycolicibacterium xanthum]